MAARFRTEAATTAGFRHKNIVIVHDYGEHFGQPYFVMELLDGRGLDKILHEGPPPSLWEKVSILLQVAEGLHYAHQRGVVHRDIKPANVILLDDNLAKILDFGISRFLDKAQTRYTDPGLIAGTLEYMAPEVLSDADADPISDIFSWGVLGYELLSGTQPFRGLSPAQTIRLISEFEPPPLQLLFPSCPPELRRVVRTAMAKARPDRYPSVQELLFGLAPIEATLRHSHAEEMAQDGGRHLIGGELDEAQAAAEKALQLDPNNERALLVRHDVKARRKRRVARTAVSEHFLHSPAAYHTTEINGGPGTKDHSHALDALRTMALLLERKLGTVRYSGTLLSAAILTLAVRILFSTSSVTSDRPLGTTETLVVFGLSVIAVVALRWVVKWGLWILGKPRKWLG